MRHLGSTMQFGNAARGIVAPDRGARFQRHAGVPPDGEFKLDDMRGAAEHGVDVAIALANDRCFAAMARQELHRRRLRIEKRRQFLDLHGDQIGRVLGDVGIVGEDGRYRIADKAHAVSGQYRLAIGIKRRNAAFAKIDRRHLGDVGCGPHRENTRHGARGRRVDGDDAAVGMPRSHHAHVKLMRKIDVAGKCAAADDERRIFQPLHGLADERFFCRHCGHATTAGGLR